MAEVRPIEGRPPSHAAHIILDVPIDHVAFKAGVYGLLLKGVGVMAAVALFLIFTAPSFVK